VPKKSKFYKRLWLLLKFTFFCTGCHYSYFHRLPEKLATPLNKQHAIFYMFQVYPHTTIHGVLTIYSVLLVPDDGV